MWGASRRPFGRHKKDRTLTKQRLMLSAAMAALAAGFASSVRADTTVAQNTTTSAALVTATAGNITIEQGGVVSVKVATPGVLINSNNFVALTGAINNMGTSAASGILVDTTAGDLTNPIGIYSIGTLDVMGAGTDKVGLAFIGGHTFNAPVLLTELTSVAQSGSTQNVTGNLFSSIGVKGDGSYGILLQRGTTINGNFSIGGPVALQPTVIVGDKSSGNTAVELDGNIQGNLVFDTQAAVTSIGNAARGVVLLGSLKPCQDIARLSYTCGTSSPIAGGAALGNVGAFVNAGAISSTGTTVIKSAGGNNEGGVALVIGGSLAGGFLNNGPATANTSTPAGTITGNGVQPVMVVDPSANLTTATSVIPGPLVFGLVPTSVDQVDGGKYGFINRGQITTRPLNNNESVLGLVINGASAFYDTKIAGGLLNTGIIQATTATSVNTNSATSATGFIVGSYATIPKIVVSSQAASSANFTAGTINALISGPGGGAATALSILAKADVPEIDVLPRASIAAQVATTTTAPTAALATSTTPFIQAAVAIIDASGGVRTINNAGGILAQITAQYPASGAVVSNTARAIDLSGGTTGATVINNSGRIQGDVLFNAGGNGNVLNVGNTGTAFTDQSGSANATITAANGGTAVTNTSGGYAVLSGVVTSNIAGLSPIADPILINFGSGTGNQLHVGSYGYVNAAILSTAGGLDVAVDNNGQLFIANNQGIGSLNVNNLDVRGGVLGLSISQTTSNSLPVIRAQTQAKISSTAVVGLQFGSFISAPNHARPTAQTITLISAPKVVDAGIADQNSALSLAIPFLFESPTEAGYAGGAPLRNSGTALTLTLVPRATGATNADGTAGLNLSGSALKLFPYTVAALGNDNTLGSAIASSLTVYNGNSGIASGINIAASQQKSQRIFSQFAPDVSGGARQVAIMITDQATGPVAARQRLLRSYGNQSGELTLWGQEFSGMVRNQGAYDGENELTVYKDHGFGFSLGMDAGSPRTGWYGGALTFYSSDINQTLPRASQTRLNWYMLTGYTNWRGNRAFLDTKLDLGYGNLKGSRQLLVGNQLRIAQGKRATLLGALGATTGVMMKYSGFDVIPHFSLDGPTMREEGYTETNGGDGFDLQVAPYYANSLRMFLGVDAKTSFDLWGAKMSPEARMGYRYDLIGAPVKLKSAFISTGGLTSPNNTFTVIGPDPDRGNVLVGFGLSGGTDTWSIGVNYDWIRGSNASTTQVGTISLLGRI